MAKTGAAQNQTVEEILASIRQAISDDETKQRAVSAPALDRGAGVSPNPVSVAGLAADAADAGDDGDARPGNHGAVVHDAQMQDVIELAIERAIDGVRAELEAGSAEPGPAAAATAWKSRRDPAVAPPRQAGLTSPMRDELRPQRPLLSQRAGAAVSASFDNLAGTMTPGHVGKVDKVVEDILRPMLRSWLDDNLPTLVERLVREEIDRVSRGRR